MAVDEDTDGFDDGWDSQATLVGGRFVERRPRRPEVNAALRRETELMPWLAPQLPLRVPQPILVSDSPLVVRHDLIPGDPCPGVDSAQGEAMGRFVRALHGVSAADAATLGVPPWELADTWSRFEHEVLPMLDREERLVGAALLERCVGAPRTSVVHCDLGPQHIRVQAAAVSGVIDWTDCCIGDPAIDLAWLLYGTRRAFAVAVAEAYAESGEVRDRARDWHRLGPWHEVLYGVDTAQPAFVESRLAGVRSRLACPPQA